jgi:hypothetical protein
VRIFERLKAVCGLMAPLVKQCRTRNGKQGTSQEIPVKIDTPRSSYTTDTGLLTHKRLSGKQFRLGPVIGLSRRPKSPRECDGNSFLWSALHQDCGVA